MTHFPTLPDSARLWILAADRPLTAPERRAALERMRHFAAGWTSHGREVGAEVTFEDDRLLLVAAYVDERSNAGVSGCGIDDMVRAAEQVADNLGFAWLDGLHVLYRGADGELHAVTRSIFRQALAKGHVTADTTVVDTTINTVGILRRHGLDRPAGASWHARVFRIAPTGTPPPPWTPEPHSR